MAFAAGLYKLMAYKDEYEVARLYTDGAFLKQVESEFDGDNLRFEFHLAPPLLAPMPSTVKSTPTLPALANSSVALKCSPCLSCCFRPTSIT